MNLRLTVRDALTAAHHRLDAANIDDAYLEAEVLLRHAFAMKRRSDLYIAMNDEVSPEQLDAYWELLERRLAHEPTAYITGHREFFGLDLKVTPDVLIPRPETELLVEIAIEFARQRGSGEPPFRIADVGTGSGAIAVAIAYSLPDAEVYALDASDAALNVARANARAQGLAQRITFLQGDLLQPLHTYVNLLAANLPYVTTSDWQALPPELREHEPRLALDGGSDGLDIIRRLLAQAPAHLLPAGVVVIEFGDGQAAGAVTAALQAMPSATVEVRNDLAGLPRALILRL